MAQAVKMNRYIAPGNDASVVGEFECWNPEPTLDARQQTSVFKEWSGGTQPFIKAGNVPMVDLPKLLEHMMKHCWKSAAVSPGAARGNVSIGAGRQAAFDKMGKSLNPADIFNQLKMKEAASNVKQVSALGFTDHGLAKFPHLQGIASDWQTTGQLQRISAYTFRGDKRTPGQLLMAGGFSPPVTRTDDYYVNSVVKVRFKDYMKRRYGKDVTDAQFLTAYQQTATSTVDRRVMNNFFVWQGLVTNESMHLGRMLADEALKGYTSTTRAVPIAKAFAGDTGWVYLTLIRGGFLVPDKGKSVWTTIFGEQEVAFPGPVPWKDIFGFRQLGNANKIGITQVRKPTLEEGGIKFVGPVYLRKGFDSDKTAFQESFELLSGRIQK